MVFERILRRIQKAVRQGRYKYALRHFPEELASDNLTFSDAEAAILTGRIVRRSLDDPRGPRFTIVGRTTDDRTVEVIVRVLESGIPLAITVYVVEEPEP